MQRLYNVDKWQRCPDGQAVNFSRTDARRVRLDVNAPDPVKLFYSDGDGEVVFLGRVVGRDVIEFQCQGEFAVTAEGSDFWFFTVDGEDYSFELPDAVILTKIAERRPRNPEFELMQYHANRNIELRMEQMRRELDSSWARRLAAAPPAAEELAAKSGGKSRGGEPAPAVEADADVGDADGADAGSGAGAGSE